MIRLDVYDPNTKTMILINASVKEVAEHFKTSDKYIRSRIDKEMPIHKKYEIKNVIEEEDNTYARDFEKRWNDAVEPFIKISERNKNEMSLHKSNT